MQLISSGSAVLNCIRIRRWYRRFEMGFNILFVINNLYVWNEINLELIHFQETVSGNYNLWKNFMKQIWISFIFSFIYSTNIPWVPRKMYELFYWNLFEFFSLIHLQERVSCNNNLFIAIYEIILELFNFFESIYRNPKWVATQFMKSFNKTNFVFNSLTFTA